MRWRPDSPRDGGQTVWKAQGTGAQRITRLHGIELHEQPWCPAFIRSALTEWLRALWQFSKAAHALAPILEPVIRASGSVAIIDLCSGRSGPILPLKAELAKLGVGIPALLTDKYPDHDLAVQFSQGRRIGLTYLAESIDATRVPPELTGLRTLFNSFHHFRPGQARAILADAYGNRQPIAVFEITQRTALRIATSFPASFFGVFPLIFLMRPKRLLWWLGTWVVPVIPLVVGWDGLISHLRSYTPRELMEMTAGMNRDGYRWETGKIKAPRAGVVVTYLIGTPASLVR